VKQSDITTTSFRLSFTTESEGNTIVRYGLTKSLGSEDTMNNLTTDHSLQLNGLSPTTFYYVQALSVNSSQDTSKSGLYYFSTASLSSGDIIVYFNNTVDTSYSKGTDAKVLLFTIDDTLVAYISRAKYSIDLALYNFNNDNLSANISDALNAAYGRGVNIRVVYDGGNANKGVTELNSGIKRIGSPQGSDYKIMHNKFIVFDANSANPDDAIVWTGSTNLTDQQIHSDFNNVIIITDQALAKAYTLEFEEMFGSTTLTPNPTAARFGQYKTDNTPHLFNVGGSLVELYFSPSDQVQQKIIDAINTADNDIYFATFVFTRNEIANPINSKYQSGVYAAGIIGDTGGFNNVAYLTLHPVLDTNVIVYSGGGKIFHHKYAIIDQGAPWLDPIVITGSHNWSSSANTGNDENTLMVHNYDVANQYIQEWAKRFAEKGGHVFVGLEKQKSFTEDQLLAIKVNGNTLNLDLYSSKNQSVELTLCDLNGRILCHQKVNVQQGINNIQLNTANYSAGVYILSAFTENIFLFKKFVSGF
jgi:phosphatidylserine/phosphatidylglycerophosphate/cardiolipin synthase-like enzyme